MPEEYKSGWICLGLIILFGIAITTLEAKSNQQIRLETLCDATEHYVVDSQGYLNQVYDCEGKLMIR